MYNRSVYTQLRKELRNNATPAERLLWNHLAARKLLGYKFRRQHGIGRYIVDFYCPKLRLAIEVDGDAHFNSIVRENDAVRTAFLVSCWIHVVRFTNAEVLKNIDEVLEQLRWIVFVLRYTTPTLRVTPP